MIHFFYHVCPWISVCHVTIVFECIADKLFESALMLVQHNFYQYFLDEGLFHR